MSSRDELASLFRAGAGEERLADAIIAAGWRPPARTVSTVEELDALPGGSVVLASDGVAWVRKSDHDVMTHWRGTHGGRATHYGLSKDAPLTLLHEGSAR